MPIKIHLTMLRRLSPHIGGGALGENLGSVCRQDSLPNITRPYTVSGVSIPFIRPIQIWTITDPF